MIRMFCDACKSHTHRNYSSQRLHMTKTINGTRVHLEVVVSMNGTWNGGELCLSCLEAVLSTGAVCDDNGLPIAKAESAGLEAK